MNERYKQAIKLRDAGKTFKEIGNEFNISDGRASQIYYKAKRLEKTNKLPNQWTYGLKTKLANTLIASGFQSKKDVIKGLQNGNISFIPGTEKGKIYGIGKHAITELSIWAGVATEQKNEINNAIQFLESHGYVVTRK